MLQRVWQKLKEFVQALTLSQKLYLVALFFVLLTVGDDSSDSKDMLPAGLIGLTGLVMDIWPKFHKLWHSLAGRILIIVLYAAIANFAVAFAAQKVNQVVGIDPAELFYAIGLVTLMMAPLWMLTLTMLFMLLYMVGLNLYLIFVAPFKLIGFIRNKGENKRQYKGLIILAQLIIVPSMLSTLVMAINSYGGQFAGNEFIKNAGMFVKNNFKSQQEDTLEGAAAEALQATNENKEALPSDHILVIENGEQDDAAEGDEDTNHPVSMDKLVAQFVYHVEAFEFSQCVKGDNERAKRIGEADILVGYKDPDAITGYSFTVRPCELVSEAEKVTEAATNSE